MLHLLIPHPMQRDARKIVLFQTRQPVSLCVSPSVSQLIHHSWVVVFLVSKTHLTPLLEFSSFSKNLVSVKDTISICAFLLEISMPFFPSKQMDIILWNCVVDLNRQKYKSVLFILLFVIFDKHSVIYNVQHFQLM